MGKTTSCFLRFRLTTLVLWKRNGAGNSSASRSPPLAVSRVMRHLSLVALSMATFTSNSVDDTIAFAREWSRSLAPNDVVALVGDLGAGKTHFVKGLLQGLASADEVTSPTFTLIHEYRSGRLPVFHFDFYRLQHLAEIEEIGFDDYLEEGGIAVVEWADRFPQVFPERTHWLRLEASSATTRTINEARS